jgi:hypothetical protein
MLNFRVCVAKRFSELEIQLAIFKLLRTYRVEWASDEKVETIFVEANYHDKKLAFSLQKYERTNYNKIILRYGL